MKRIKQIAFWGSAILVSQAFAWGVILTEDKDWPRRSFEEDCVRNSGRVAECRAAVAVYRP